MNRLELTIISSVGFPQCSKSCGGGAKRRVVVCQDENHTQVETEFCDSSHRPESSLPCNEESCSPHWTVGDWTEVRLLSAWN